MVNELLGEDRKVTIEMNKRDYYYLLGLLAEANITKDIKQYMKVIKDEKI